MTKENKKQQEANYIVTIGQHLEFAQLSAEAYATEQWVSGSKKNTLKGLIRRIEVGKNDLFAFVTEKGQEMIKNNLVDADTVGNIIAVQTMMMHLPKAIREECEAYVRARFNLYQNN